jgi:glycerol-3-phosphate acyltransferase PlsY
MTLLSAFGFPLLGYLCGSLPFAVWVTRLTRGVDVRDAGSHHATATNTIRQAGFAPGALVGLLDLAKAYLPVWLALRFAPEPWIVALTAALAVAGHCWPVFAQFRGGMGLACMGGGLLAASLLAFLLTAALLIAVVLLIRHGARASVFTGLAAAPLAWLFGLRDVTLWIALATGLVIAVRFLIDWNRQYRELWLDRERPGGTG